MTPPHLPTPSHAPLCRDREKTLRLSRKGRRPRLCREDGAQRQSRRPAGMIASPSLFYRQPHSPVATVADHFSSLPMSLRASAHLLLLLRPQACEPSQGSRGRGRVRGSTLSPAPCCRLPRLQMRLHGLGSYQLGRLLPAVHGLRWSTMLPTTLHHQKTVG